MTLQPSTPEWANDPDWGREFARQFPTVDAYLAHHQAAGSDWQTQRFGRTP